MRTEGSPTEIRVSCSSNMNDLRNQNSFDFVPKSDYNEKWHLENKCLFHNQQFLEGDNCDTGKYCLNSPPTCNFCSHSEHKLKFNIDTNYLNQKSGDWIYDDDFFEYSLPTNVTHQPYTDWKKKNLYSFSDFDRSNHWNQSCMTSTTFPTNFSRGVDKINTGFEDATKSESNRNFLQNFREYLVNYQESCGVPRTEYSFSALIRIMGQATGRSLLALLYVLMNIIPVVEVFLYILRFVLDKMISIRNSKDFRQTITRCAVFMTELISVYSCLIFIFGFIVLPIVQMVIGVIAKIMLYN